MYKKDQITLKVQSFPFLTNNHISRENRQVWKEKN